MIKAFRLVFIITLILFLSCSKEKNPSGFIKYIDSGEPQSEFVLPDNEDIVMYEVNLRAFSQTGDIPGVIQRIDEIKKLGVNVIWLMPIHPIGEINSVNSPYSVQNYTEVNPEFGTLEDLINLIEEAHERNIAVILDWVANHTSWDNPWISNTDWYTQDGSGNIVHPPGTNWLDVADLNFDNQEMRIEMINSMIYWIDEADIDGFRCDAADWVPHDFWKQAVDSLMNYSDKNLILLAEGARTDHFDAGFDLNFSWNYYNALKDLFNGSSSISSLYSTHNNEYNNVPEGKHRLRFTTNHDESAWDQTPMGLYNGKDGALAASALTIFLGGVPMIYSSQEVGVVENVPFFSSSPINWDLNPDMLEMYQEMLQFYNSSNASRRGELKTYYHSSVAIFKRYYQDEEFLVLVNTKNENTSFAVPGELQGTSWENALDGTVFTLSETIELDPYQFLLLN